MGDDGKRGKCGQKWKLVRGAPFGCVIADIFFTVEPLPESWHLSMWFVGFAGFFWLFFD
jgi:hypothetical protein